MFHASQSRFLLLAAVVLASVLTACGSSGSKSTATAGSEPATKAQFAKQGNEICAQVAPRQREAVKDFEGGEDERELEEVVAAALGPVEEMAGELSSLAPPPAQTKAMKAYLTELEAGIAAAEANPAAAVSGTAFMKANVAAEQAGLPRCVI